MSNYDNLQHGNEYGPFTPELVEDTHVYHDFDSSEDEQHDTTTPEDSQILHTTSLSAASFNNIQGDHNAHHQKLIVRTNTGIHEEDATFLDPFTQFHEFDGFGHNFPRFANSYRNDNEARLGNTIHRVDGEQNAANRMPRTHDAPDQQALPSTLLPAPVHVGYDELRSADHTLTHGINDAATAGVVPHSSSYPLEGIQDSIHEDAVYALQMYKNESPPAVPLNQQPYEGYVQAVYEQANEDEDEDKEDDSEHKSSLVPAPHRRSVRTSIPRTRGNRIPPRRSDPHLHFSSTDPQAIREATLTLTIDNARESGVNLMAIYDKDPHARTRYPLRIERGRADSHASANHPDCNTEIPARQTLEEICQKYPNHVWGSGLRIFMHEQMPASKIWDHLPSNFRMKGCKNRPHNYLQAAIGREIDHMMKNSGDKRAIIKRKTRDEDQDDEEAKPVAKKRQMTTPSTAMQVPMGYSHYGSRLAAPTQGPQRSFVSTYTTPPPHNTHSHVMQLPYPPQPFYDPQQHPMQPNHPAQQYGGLMNPVQQYQPTPFIQPAPTPDGGFPQTPIAPPQRMQRHTMVSTSGSPSYHTPPTLVNAAHTIASLETLINNEFLTYDRLLRDYLTGRNCHVSEAFIQQRQADARRNLNHMLEADVIRRWNLQMPAGGNRPATLMRHVLMMNMPGSEGLEQAEVLAHPQDNTARALNWYLAAVRNAVATSRWRLGG